MEEVPSALSHCHFPSWELSTGWNSTVIPVPIGAKEILPYVDGKQPEGKHVERVVPSCDTIADVKEGVMVYVIVNVSPMFFPPVTAWTTSPLKQ